MAVPSIQLAQWSKEEARRWYEQQPWLCGFNYIPATAINYTEMWQRETYDPKTIDEELALAETIGFNCVRVVLQYLVWESDPEGTLERMNSFMAIAHKRKMGVMWCLFDDCAFGTKTDPYLGKQADVVPGFYANDWSPSPGHGMVRDPSTWPRLEAYVKEIVGRFADDDRVLIWDLYNEPNEALKGDAELVVRVFDWARAQRPTQPLTVAIWRQPQENEDIITTRSDILTMHIYRDERETAAMLDEYARFDRPIICTEWLNRPRNSGVANVLPVFFDKRVGCFFWGLVNGKTQTQHQWGSKAGTPEPDIWQHDIFRADRTPYNPQELELFRHYLELSTRIGEGGHDVRTSR